MLKRKSNSVIGRSISRDVKGFLLDNYKALEGRESVSADEGAEDLANAIAYGICKSISSSQMQSSFAAGICPPSGGAVGNLIFSQIKANSSE